MKSNLIDIDEEGETCNRVHVAFHDEAHPGGYRKPCEGEMVPTNYGQGKYWETYSACDTCGEIGD